MTMDLKLFFQLGRLGDILNILPLVKRYRDDSGMKPLLMVAEEFAGLMDGVSYAEPVIFSGKFNETRKAMFEARRITTDIVCCQIYGDSIITQETTFSFARESWVSAGATVPWGSLPLTVDRRDSAREAALAEIVMPKTNRPVVLICLGGISAPFPQRRAFVGALLAHLPTKFEVVDISGIRAERVYDLLGLMDRAHCLISIDTGVKHLAHASDVPVISLCTRDPTAWHGTSWRPNHVGFYYYDEQPRLIEQLVRDIQSARTPTLRPKIFHAWADRDLSALDPMERARVEMARESWKIEQANGRWASCPLEESAIVRSGLDVGDPHRVPFVKDVIAQAIAKAGKPTDIIALTNGDVHFVPGLTGRVLEHVDRYGAVFTHRWDFLSLYAPIVSESTLRHGLWYSGSDAFFFSVDWWNHFGHEFGDYLVGREHWDEALRQLIKLQGGVGLDRAIAHVIHDSFWQSDPSVIQSNPGNLHNRGLLNQWFERTGLQTDDWRWWKCIEVGNHRR